MDTHPLHPAVSVTHRTELQSRATLALRLQSVRMLQMSERDVAAFIQSVESEPDFGKLIHPQDRSWKVIRFQPHPRTSLSPSFYQMNENTPLASGGSDAASVLVKGRGALGLIKKMGQELFEKYFLRADHEMDSFTLSHLLKIKESDIKKIRDFLLSYSVQTEFFDPSPRSQPGQHVVRLARVNLDEKKDPIFEFMSPLLARGRYAIDYDRLWAVLKNPDLPVGQRNSLKSLIRRLEMINWRQNTIYRILERLCHAQRHYLSSQDVLKKTPITQRQMSHQLAVAPSTINRAIGGRSLVLPWGEELLLEEMFCSRQSLCVEILEVLEVEDPEFSKRTDHDLQDHFKSRLNIMVPRRTINNYRRSMAKISKKA